MTKRRNFETSTWQSYVFMTHWCLWQKRFGRDLAAAKADITHKLGINGVKPVAVVSEFIIQH